MFFGLWYSWGVKRIAIFGCGKLGSAVAAAAQQAAEAEVVAMVDPRGSAQATHASLPADLGADVAIDCTTPKSAPENLLHCIDRGLPVACGTTGWDAQMPRVHAAAQKAGVPVIASGNFSPGVNVFFRALRAAASSFDALPGGDVAIFESHHTAKKDAPSGTALAAARAIFAGTKKKTSTCPAEKAGKMPEQLGIAALRVGAEVGMHEAMLDMGSELLTIRCQSRNREGFAAGALAAALFLAGDKHGLSGGLHRFEDIFEDIFRHTPPPSSL